MALTLPIPGGHLGVWGGLLNDALGELDTTKVATDDSRLSDARPPTTHSHTADDVAPTTARLWVPSVGTSGYVLKVVGGVPAWAPDADTTYAVPSQAEAQAGVETIGRAFSAQRVAQAIGTLSPVQSVASKTGAVTLAKGDVGLGNVDNTTDANKPVSTAQQTALNAKAPLASPAFTGTPTGITKTHVGLGSVDNTADSGKPVVYNNAVAPANVAGRLWWDPNAPGSDLPSTTMVDKTIVDTKGDMIVGSAADTVIRMAAGADGSTLETDSTTATGLKWATGYVKNTIVDAKGDLLAGTAADAPTRVPVGSNGASLVADSGQTAGVRWATDRPAVNIESGGVYPARPTATVVIWIGATDPGANAQTNDIWVP